MPAKLTDLPTELILHILQDVRTQSDLYAVGVVCKRLNLIAIPLLLEAQGVSNPEDYISLSFGYKSLHPSQLYPGLSSVNRRNNELDQTVPVEAAIMVAFYISSIREVKCSFPQSFPDLQILLHHLERLSYLISRLKSINSITFIFLGDHMYRHLSLNPLSANAVPFADIFGHIIQSLTSKACERLLLHNQSHRLQGRLERGAELDEPIATRSPPSFSLPDIPRPMDGDTGLGKGVGIGPNTNLPDKTVFTGETKGMKAILSWTWVKFESTLRHLGLYAPASSTSKPPLIPKNANLLYLPFDPLLIDPRASGTLRTLYIQTSFALLPRCLPAIRSIIHSSARTLTALSLSYIVFDQHLFDLCLSSLFLNRPNAIIHLSILHCRQISPKSFLEFLTCFQGHLEYLEFDQGMSDITGTEDLPRVHFSELHTLKAPLDWVTYLLMTPLSNLSILNINAELAQPFILPTTSSVPISISFKTHLRK